MCSIDDADSWVIFRKQTRKARKDHTCYECNRTIERGETYEFSTGLLDDYWYTHHHCAHCAIAAGWLVTICRGYLFGNVIDELAEHYDEGYESLWLGRVIIGARNRWRLRDGSLAPLPARFKCDHRYGPRYGSTRCPCGHQLEEATAA